MFARVVVVLVVAVFLWAVFARESGATGPERYHVVQAGETIWSIVDDTYAGDPREGVWKLQRRNELDGTTIVPGQRLVLP
jgi:LysM repeat protein